MTKEKSNKCACGLSASEFTFGMTALADTAGELVVHEPYKIPPNLILVHVGVAAVTLKNLDDIGINCDIDIKPERERFISLKSKLVQMNNPKINNEIRDDASAIMDSIRTKLKECSK